MYTVDFNGQILNFKDTPTLPALINEMFTDNYKIFERGLKLSLGDVVIDVGANEGVFTVLIAKAFPGVKIVALEPVARTFNDLLENCRTNNVEVDARQVGIGSGYSELIVSKTYSGGSTAVCTFNPEHHYMETVNLVSLDSILEEFPEVKLLKIDIEGMEYNALYDCKLLDRIEYCVAEFHINNKLLNQGYGMNELATFIGSKMNLVYYATCKMAE